MERLIKYIFDNQEIEKLDVDEADQALYYIDFLLDEEVDIKEIIRLMRIKTELVKLINHLNSPQVPIFAPFSLLIPFKNLIC